MKLRKGELENVLKMFKQVDLCLEKLIKNGSQGSQAYKYYNMLEDIRSELEARLEAAPVAYKVFQHLYTEQSYSYNGRPCYCNRFTYVGSNPTAPRILTELQKLGIDELQVKQARSLIYKALDEILNERQVQPQRTNIDTGDISVKAI